MQFIKKLYTLRLRLMLLSVMPALTSTLILNAGDAAGKNLELSPSGVLKSWYKVADPMGTNTVLASFNKAAVSDTSDIGFFWWDPRDIERIEIGYESDNSSSVSIPVVQYWQKTWPETPPAMPSKEDLEDDPWQGRWLTASTNVKTAGGKSVITFTALSTAENSNAEYLPAPVNYRRTLKLRLLYTGKHPAINSFRVFSVSKEKQTSVRFEFLKNEKNKLPVDGTLEVFNGQITGISPWHWEGSDKKTGANSFRIHLKNGSKGIIAGLTASDKSLPGSNDETVITMKSSAGTYSVSLNDIAKGPVYIPFYNVYITLASDLVPFSEAAVVKGNTTRERIPSEPEQTYDRAKKEIPALDPTSRVGGGYIDLPLAADASWQKFAVQWGGNIVLDKTATKAMGRELARCNWTGSDLRWSIGTGKNPVYNRTLDNCRMTFLNDYIPVVQADWNHNGLEYREESFVTLLNGPLSPDDPARDEQTPAILMIRITVANPTNRPDTAQIWLSGNKAVNGLSLDGDFILDKVKDSKYIRCFMPDAGKAGAGISIADDVNGMPRKIHRELPLGANSSSSFVICFPFVGDLTPDAETAIKALDFDIQKERVIRYWRDIVSDCNVFNVPERKFNEMSKAVIPHIRISVTKDPKSGLYMVPAAAFSYWVYPNESVFQTLLLDRMRDFKTSGEYLNTFMELQGSEKLPGMFTGDQKDVFFGTKVDDEYSYCEPNGYNMHHGTVLWGLSRHYLYSHDSIWLLKAKPHMIRAAKWIIEQRGQNKVLDEKGSRVPHYGLLPPGDLEDPQDWQFWYATNAYACMGLDYMAKAFENAGFPEAEYYRKEAAEYRNDIRNSIQVSSELCPVVRLRNNTYVPYVPTRPYQRFRYFGTKKAEYYDRYNLHIYPTLRLSATREVLYGPVTLLKAGLIAADEPMADWILDDWEDNLTLSSSMNLNVHGRVEDEYWFSKGGMVFQANLQNPVSIYLQRKEIPATIRGIYDNFVSCLYPDVNAHTEEYREWGHGSGPFYKCPDEARFIAQVCDLLVVERNNEIWLAAGTPRRWLEPGQLINVNKLRTEFGELSYTMKPMEKVEGIEADIEPPSGICPKILLFVRSPYQKPFRQVRVNGQIWTSWNAADESILLPVGRDKIKVEVLY